MSYIPHMDAPVHTITYNGVDLSTFGLYVSGNKTFDAPERDYERTEVPGRSGDLLFDNGRFKNVELHYEYCFIAGDFEAKFSELKNFLMSEFGYLRLEDTYHPDEYRLAAFSGPIEVSMDAGLDVGTFDLVFDCKPQRYLKSGEEWIELELSGEGGYSIVEGGEKIVSDYKFYAYNDEYDIMDNVKDPYEVFTNQSVYAFGFESPFFEKSAYVDTQGDNFIGFDIRQIERHASYSYSPTWWYLGGEMETSHVPDDVIHSIVDYFVNDGRTMTYMMIDYGAQIIASSVPTPNGPVSMYISSDIPVLGMGWAIYNPESNKYRHSSTSGFQWAGNAIPDLVTETLPNMPEQQYYKIPVTASIRDTDQPSVTYFWTSGHSWWWYPFSNDQQVYIVMHNSTETEILLCEPIYIRKPIYTEINNPTYFKTKSIISLEMTYANDEWWDSGGNHGYTPHEYGKATINIGNSAFTIDFSGKLSSKQVTPLFIDLETGVCVDSNGNDYSSKIIFDKHNVPVLEPALNAIAITGDNTAITGMSVYPRWYKI